MVSHVSLRVAAGEIVTLIGPNGAGKTTLLKCMLGLVAPDAGVVTRAQNLRIGYVPQHFHVPRGMPLSVQSFLALYHGRVLTSLSQIEAWLGIEGLLNKPMQALSGGELRRVLLARALLGHPNLLVLDEPTQGIDIRGQAEFYRMLGTIRDAFGMAVLMVSHDVHIVMSASNRVVCLHHHICCEGTPEAVGANPAFRQLFGDETAAQFALYHHHHHHRHAPDGAVIEEHACEGHAHG